VFSLSDQVRIDFTAESAVCISYEKLLNQECCHWNFRCSIAYASTLFDSICSGYDLDLRLL